MFSQLFFCGSRNRQCPACPTTVVNLSRHVHTAHHKSLRELRRNLTGDIVSEEKEQISNFRKHLTGPAGLAGKTANQYATYIRRIITEGCDGDFKKIFQVATWDSWWGEGEGGRGGFLVELRKTKKVNTYRTYLHALAAYATYHKYKGNNVNSAESLFSRIKCWLKASAKDRARRRVELKDHSLISTKALIQAMIDYTQNDANRLSKQQEAWDSTDYTNARNHLIIMTFIGNGHRSGVLRNMKTTEVKEAQIGYDNQYAIITVTQHKTDAQFSARVVLSFVLWQSYCTFHEKKKQFMGDRETEYFFTRTTGKQLKSNEVSLFFFFGICLFDSCFFFVF